MKFDYCADDFKNPAITKIWSEIDAIALDRNESQKLVDLTIPNNERIKIRAGEFLEDIMNKFQLEIETKSKRKVNIFKFKNID